MCISLYKYKYKTIYIKFLYFPVRKERKEREVFLPVSMEGKVFFSDLDVLLGKKTSVSNTGKKKMPCHS
jgi:hypothetical protein